MSQTTKRELPIGIFDSGIGGLTVLRALKQILPEEHFLYLGDTARLPYGTKSPETVRNYALSACEILVNSGVKALVVACNTVSAIALNDLKRKFYPLPVIGVIHAGALASLQENENGPIVVLATESTVSGHAYRDMITALSPVRQVIEYPCSLMVALAEEGWCQGLLVEQIINKMLSPLFASFESTVPGCIVLGCTHFPVLKAAIENVVQGIRVIDPAFSVAKEVHGLLSEQGLLNPINHASKVRFLATDGVERFARVAQVFLGHPISAEEVELVSLPLNASSFRAVG